MTNGQISFLNRIELMGCVSGLALIVALDGADAQDITPVPPVSVNATPSGPQPLDGSAAAGYRVINSTAAGPIWSDLPVQDAPYSISVISAPLIDNLQATSMDDLYKVIPQITNSLPSMNKSGSTYFYIRGYLVSAFKNAGTGIAYDGLQGGIGGVAGTTLEDKERVEVLSGVSGFLYGTGNVGGFLNYVLKRPTETPYASVTLGNNAGANMSIHGDFGGPLNIPGMADGLIGYRLNIAGQDGSTSIDNQTVKHEIISGAFDIHLPYDILVQLNASHSSYQIDGTSQNYFTTVNPYPSPVNPAKIVANSWTEFGEVQDTGGIKTTWKLNDIFTLRAAYAHTREQILSGPDTSNTIVNSSGKLTESNSYYDAPYPVTRTLNSGYAFLDTTFDTFGVQHKLTTGFTGYSDEFYHGTVNTFPIPYTFKTNFYNQSAFNDPGTTTSYNKSGGYVDGQYFAKTMFLAMKSKLATN